MRATAGEVREGYGREAAVGAGVGRGERRSTGSGRRAVELELEGKVRVAAVASTVGEP